MMRYVSWLFVMMLCGNAMAMDILLLPEFLIKSGKQHAVHIEHNSDNCQPGKSPGSVILTEGIMTTFYVVSYPGLKSGDIATAAIKETIETNDGPVTYYVYDGFDLRDPMRTQYLFLSHPSVINGSIYAGWKASLSSRIEILCKVDGIVDPTNMTISSINN
jgi:hypothetical protein